MNPTRVAALSKSMLVFFTLVLLLVPVVLFLLTSMSRGAMAVVVLAFVFVFSSGMSALAELIVPSLSRSLETCSSPDHPSDAWVLVRLFRRYWSSFRKSILFPLEFYWLEVLIIAFDTL
jgi:hypothetical protein